jgi:threonine dehydratase
MAATDGNHGRAIAYMGAIFGIPTDIFVPRGLDSATVEFIKGEGAKVIEVDGSYDLAVQAATEVAERSSECILVQDTAFQGYEDIPKVSVTDLVPYESLY